MVGQKLDSYTENFYLSTLNLISYHYESSEHLDALVHVS